MNHKPPPSTGCRKCIQVELIVYGASSVCPGEDSSLQLRMRGVGWIEWCINKSLEYLIQGVPVNKIRRQSYQVCLTSNHMMPFDDTLIGLALGDHAIEFLQFWGTEQCGKQLSRVTMFEGSFVFCLDLLPKFGQVTGLPVSQSVYNQDYRPPIPSWLQQIVNT